MTRTIHIIGAGLAGLAAAVRLSGRGTRVVVHEATSQAGGRCRSYYDRAVDLTIDNGNHLLLSGNTAALDFLRTLGSTDRMSGPDGAIFPFVDLATDKRWTLHFNDGRLPWWIFDKSRRVPDTRATDYLRLAPLLWAPAGKSVGEVVRCEGPLYDRLMQPVLLAALNIDPPQGEAALAGVVVRETIALGGRACRPLIAREGLDTAFVEPAIKRLQGQGADIRFGHELRALGLDGARVAALDFGADAATLMGDDAVILAVPPWSASGIVPGITVPNAYKAIVNAHFRVPPPKDFPPMIGVLNGAVEWIFAFAGRLSVTISDADRLIDTPRETLARQVWQEVARVARLPDELPPWQIVRERRATFAATPEQNARRPQPQTQWTNLFLAGDWTATGLPATIESAIRSGNRAADLVGTLN